MLRTLLPLPFLLLMGCSTQEPRGSCGESFCLPASANLLAKETPVHDFNLYQVQWRGERFGIYEGNHPQVSVDDSSMNTQLPIDPSAMLHVYEGRGDVLIKVSTDCQSDELCWPAALHVMGPCQSSKQCRLKDFAAELSLR